MWSTRIEDPLVFDRLVVTVCRPPQRRSCRLVGQLNLAGFERTQQTPERVGFPDGRLRVAQALGGPVQVILDPGDPAEQFVAEDLGQCMRQVDRHDPWAGRRVLISHEELTLLLVRPSAGVRAPPGAELFGVTKLAKSKIYLH
jgi:hypothetical protein